MKEIYKALANFQNEVPVIHQNTKGYNYTYSDLKIVFDVIKPLLKKNGLGFTQLLQNESLETILFHNESGEVLKSVIEIPKVQLKGQNEFQSLGSGITYLRRYSLSCMLGLITDKDADAHGEQEKKQVLTINSKPFHGGISKKTTIEVMKQHFEISEEVEKEYKKQLNIEVNCDATEIDLY